MCLVKMRNIYKSFGHVVALRGVDFDVGPNEVVGLIGDNGAGKSTLIKILCGVMPPTRGEIYVKGQKIDPRKYSVRMAHELGIEPVYQEQALAVKQPLWRNIFIGRQPTTWLGFIRIKEAKKQTEDLLRRFLGFTGAGVDSDTTVRTLSGGERQGVAIARAMFFQADLVVMDEPTTALSLQESAKVLDFIQKIKEHGKSCVYISHNIADVFSVSDRFVVLDRGEVVAEYEKAKISESELIEALLAYRGRGAPRARESGHSTRKESDSIEANRSST